MGLGGALRLRLEESVLIRNRQIFEVYGTKAWANQYLSWHIGALKGRNVGQTEKGRLQLALYAKDELERHGFWWQAAILEIWIRRAQKGEFSSSSSFHSELAKQASVSPSEVRWAS